MADATFPSGHFPSHEVLLREFFSRVGKTVDHASFGVDGPVVTGQARITTLYCMDETNLARDLTLSSVHLLNDVLAFAHAPVIIGLTVTSTICLIAPLTLTLAGLPSPQPEIRPVGFLHHDRIHGPDQRSLAEQRLDPRIPYEVERDQIACLYASGGEMNVL